jgi:hypothetical protein
MHGEPDRKEIDLLIRELTTKPRESPPAGPAISQPFSRLATAARPAAQPVAAQPAAVPPGRWTNVRLLMPSRPAPVVAKRFAFDAALNLPHPAELTAFFRMPGPVTLARMWVALGAAYSASMTFWPYPKTYLWGMVLYLLCLGLALVASIWGARLSWDARRGSAHTVALGTTFWAVTLAIAETLPLM